MFAKKSLGQHFLKDPRALRRIVDAAHLVPTDVVLEVGPGEGALTAFLLQRAGKVVAVEKDARLISHLQQRFAAEIARGKLELIHNDILTSTLPHFGTYKLVANIPYYITGALLKKFLQSERQPSSLTLLLQKEVAQRIVAGGGKESILSISVKCYGVPRIVGVVQAGAFSPPPKVDSAILTLENISKKFFKNPSPTPSFIKEGGRGWISEACFFALVKKGFAHPRKLLASNLGMAKEVLVQCGIKENARAEEVSREEWKYLCEQNPPPAPPL